MMTDNIDHIEKLINNALADGRLCRKDSELIRNAIYHNGVVTEKRMRLWRELQARVTNGEILLEN